MLSRTRSAWIGVLILMLGAGLSFGLESAGYEILDTRQDGDTLRVDVRDPDGNEFEVRGVDTTVSERRLQILNIIRTTAFRIDSIDIDSMSVLFAGDRADILIVPSRVEFQGRNLRPYVPSGFQLFFDQVLEYDFRLRVEEHFLRLRGQYVDEESFFSRISDAVDDPVRFLESQRPEFVAQRLEEFDEQLGELRGELGRTREELDRVEGKLHQTQGELGRTHGELSETEAELERTRVDLLNLQMAVLAYNNKTFFGRVRPLDEHVVERIVALREAYPEADNSDIRDMLSEEDLSASRNEVDIVLAVYFREF